MNILQESTEESRAVSLRIFFQQQITKGTKPSALSPVSEEWLCFPLLPPVKTVSEESLRSLRYLLSNSTLPLSSIV